MTNVIIFDLGGVVLRGKFMEHMLAHAAKAFGVQPFKLRRVMREEEGPLERGEESDVHFWRRVCQRLNVDPPEARVLRTLLRHHYASQSKIDPAMRRMIRTLRRQYTVVALTNTSRSHVAINRRRGLFKLFDRAFISSDMGMRKPERRVFVHIAGNLRVQRSSMLLIDDDARWVRAARKHGVLAVRFTSPNSLKVHLRNAGVAV